MSPQYVSCNMMLKILLCIVLLCSNGLAKAPRAKNAHQLINRQYLKTKVGISEILKAYDDHSREAIIFPNDDMLHDPVPRRHKRHTLSQSMRGFAHIPEERICRHNCLNGRCVYDAFSASVLCQCMIGYEGVGCDLPVYSCNKSAHLCGANGICINQVGTHVCQCKDNSDPDRVLRHGERFLFGHSCHTAVTNPCSEKDLEGGMVHLARRSFHPLVGSPRSFIQCVLDSFVVRRCPRGQRWQQWSLSCILDDTNETDNRSDWCSREPCFNGGICRQVSTPARDESSFECNCKLPFKGKFCTERIDMCDIEASSTLIDGYTKSYPPNRCGDICLNSETYPYFSCICSRSIVAPFPCDSLNKPPRNKCSTNINRYQLADNSTDRLWIDCDQDGVGFVKFCPAGQTFSNLLQICTPPKANLTFIK